jgi:dihydrofolate reductase
MSQELRGSRKPIEAVVAYDVQFGIGKDEKIPWKLKLKKDGERFRDLTTNTVDKSKVNAVIMGKATYFSIPPRFRPLQNRLNVVLSTDPDIANKLPAEVLSFNSMTNALTSLNENPLVEKIIIAGGSGPYYDAIQLGATLRITKVFSEYECNVFFPTICDNDYFIHEETDKQVENGIEYQFLTYTPKGG